MIWNHIIYDFILFHVLEAYLAHFVRIATESSFASWKITSDFKELIGKKTARHDLVGQQRQPWLMYRAPAMLQPSKGPKPLQWPQWNTPRKQATTPRQESGKNSLVFLNKKSPWTCLKCFWEDLPRKMEGPIRGWSSWLIGVVRCNKINDYINVKAKMHKRKRRCSIWMYT